MSGPSYKNVKRADVDNSIRVKRGRYPPATSALRGMCYLGMKT